MAFFQALENHRRGFPTIGASCKKKEPVWRVVAIPKQRVWVERNH